MGAQFAVASIAIQMVKANNILLLDKPKITEASFVVQDPLFAWLYVSGICKVQMFPILQQQLHSTQLQIQSKLKSLVYEN